MNSITEGSLLHARAALRYSAAIARPQAKASAEGPESMRLFLAFQSLCVCELDNGLAVRRSLDGLDGDARVHSVWVTPALAVAARRTVPSAVLVGALAFCLFR
jgi:hypothetical protein